MFLFDHETLEIPVDATFTSLVTIKYTSGKESLESIKKDAISGADGVLACFSLADSHSLESTIKKWIPEVRSILGADIPIVLVGRKSDLRDGLLNAVSHADKRSSKRIIPVQSKEAGRASKVQAEWLL